jgi:hypothetical protein
MAKTFPLFSGADSLDWLLVVLGIVGALGNGKSMLCIGHRVWERHTRTRVNFSNTLGSLDALE